MTDESVFAAALALGNPTERAAYLDRACANNSALRQEVEGLLAAHAASNPLDRPAPAPERTGAYDPQPDSSGPTASVGDRVGPYKLLERLGEGGMGEVWIADQLEPIKRRVALKLIKPGMDSRGVLARFEAERQALALMDHPNIAKVLDAGTTPEGRPFFVMELVKGTPITEFCDTRRLTPKERLELFIPVCLAIQHAHQKGIIHRDIKPSNVLVELHDDKPVAKVIDFGMAKALGQRLTDRTIYTGLGTVVGTPAYMAPEQASFNALDIDTRADVYALGVLLYELLAGSPPIERQRIRRAAMDEVLRIVREEEPPRPSDRLSTSEAKASIAAARQSEPLKLAQLMRGELDWIVMRALEKDRARRYDTPSGMAKDVQRYLMGDAVEACPPTMGYRLRKFYRRNRTAVRVAVAFVLLALGAVVVSAALAVWATKAERDTADERDRTGRERDRAIEAEADALRKGAEAHDALIKFRRAVSEKGDSEYLFDMQLLPVVLEAGSTVEAKRLLARHVPEPDQADRRAIEWYHWTRLFTPRATARLEQVDPAQARAADVFTGNDWAASADGSRVAQIVHSWGLPFSFAGGRPPDPLDPPILTVWDVHSRKVLLKHQVSTGNAGRSSSQFRPAMWLSGDGRWAALAFIGNVAAIRPNSPRSLRDGQLVLRVIDVDRRTVRYEYAGPSQLIQNLSCEFSADGRWLQTVYDNMAEDSEFRVRLFDLDKAPPASPPPAKDDPLGLPPLPDVKDKLPKPPLPDFKDKLPKLPPLPKLKDDLPGLPVLPPLPPLPGGKDSPPRLFLLGNEATPPVLNPAPRAPRCPISPDGSWLAYFDGKRVVVRDLATGKERGWALPNTQSCVLALSPDGRRLAALAKHDAGARTLRIWEAATGTQLHSTPLTRTRAGRDGVERGLTLAHIYFSPDGSRLATAVFSSSDPDRVIDLNVWDTASGTPYPVPAGVIASDAAITVNREKWLRSLPKFTPDGRRLVHASGPTIRSWDTRTGRAGPTFRGDSESVQEFAVSPDGSTCWSVDGSGLLKEWSFRPDGPVDVPLGVRLTSGGTGPISSDGRRCVISVPVDGAKEDRNPDHKVLVWEHGKPSRVLIPPQRDRDPSVLTMHGLALSGDGHRAALVRSDLTLLTRADKVFPDPDLTVWDVDRGIVLLHQKLPPRVYYHEPLLAPDGSAVAVFPVPSAANAAVSRERPLIQLFAVDAGRPNALPLPDGLAPGTVVRSGAFSPDGRRLAVALTGPLPEREGKLVVWDLVSGAHPGARSVPFVSERLVWSADGERVAAVHNRQGRPDGAFRERIWSSDVSILDPATGTVRVTLEQPLEAAGHRGLPLVAVTFSPDRRRVAALFDSAPFEDAEVHVWDTETGKLLLTQAVNTVRLGAFTVDLSFSADGCGLTIRQLGTTRSPDAEKEKRLEFDLTLSVRTLGATPDEGRAK